MMPPHHTGKVDMVIEAVIEDIGLKQRIFAGEWGCCGLWCVSP
jgi:hypothetical protein